MLSKDELKRQVCEAIDQRADAIINIGKTIRHHPELGLKECKTAALMAETLRNIGVPHKTGLAITGVKGELPGAKPGPTLALLGELDGLVVGGHPLADAETGAW